MTDSASKPDDAPIFSSMAEVRRRNQAAGLHWFSADSLRFFRSRVSRTLHGGRFFVSSEQNGYDGERLWSVREALADGRVVTVGEFQGYASHAAATKAARDLGRQ